MATIAGTLGLSRIDIKYSAGTLPHGPMQHSIELLGEKVKPLVLDMLEG